MLGARVVNSYDLLYYALLRLICYNSNGLGSCHPIRPQKGFVLEIPEKNFLGAPSDATLIFIPSFEMERWLEWLKALVSKTGMRGYSYRGFESLPLRQEK